MSEKISTIENEARPAITAGNSAKNNADPGNKTFPEVVPISKLVNPEETIPELRYKTVFTYNGNESDTRPPAVELRNADIDDEIGVVQGKMDACTSALDSLNSINSKLENSLQALSSDLDAVGTMQTISNDFKNALAPWIVGFPIACANCSEAFGCYPSSLSFDTGQALLTVVNTDCNSGAISHVRGELSRWANKGRELKAEIDPIVQELPDKIEVLSQRIEELNGMKE